MSASGWDEDYAMAEAGEPAGRLDEELAGMLENALDYLFRDEAYFPSRRLEEDGQDGEIASNPDPDVSTESRDDAPATATTARVNTAGGGRPPLLSSSGAEGEPSGIKLKAIGLTLAGGAIVSTLTVAAFGLAVLWRHPNVAPRCTARHPNTIWRSRRDIAREERERGGGGGGGRGTAGTAASGNGAHDDCDDGGGSPAKERRPGGVSPSGKDGGVSGDFDRHPQDRGNPFLGWIPWTLRLSYDRMLRGIPGTGTRDGGMAGKLLGVNLDAIVLFRFHALCLRVTAVACLICVGIILPLNITACTDPRCNADLTDYGRTTIANVVYGMSEGGTAEQSEVQISVLTKFFTEQTMPSPQLLRLYVISICTWYITYFALKNIKRDWRENLVLRRVYYLEADHYGNRQSELERTAQTERDGGSGGEPNECADDGTDLNNNGGKSSRDPWIPHPEHRDTVPNIELYSVLVGGLPSLPDEVVNSRDMQTALGFSKQASIDWQLAVATTFFDHCVPNQPGFSSSVVAVTILPGAPELAKAWRKWYAAAAALRRLRFIREVINEKRYYDIDDVDQEMSVDEEYDSSSYGQDPSKGEVQSDFCRNEQPKPALRAGNLSRSNMRGVDYQVFRSLNYGPEQQAVYSREFAQGAAACCPNGCNEERVRRQPIDQLLAMEESTISRLEKAQLELQCAQMQAAVSIVDDGGQLLCKPIGEANSPRSNDSSGGVTSPRLEGGALEMVSAFDAAPVVLSTSDTMDIEAQSCCEPGLTPVNGDAALYHHRPAPQCADSSFLRSPANNVASPTSTDMRSTILRLNSEARFMFDDVTSDAREESSFFNKSSLPGVASLRRRANTAQSAFSEGAVSKSSSQWNQVNSILRTRDAEDRHDREIESGVWQKPSLKSFAAALKTDFLSSLKAACRWTKGKTDPITSKLAKDSTYAVVTFSSRQAAVAARHCLHDGRGVERWLSVETVPVPPLADAAPCDIITCRGCCRPVTLNLNQNQLMLRRYIALGSLAFIYIFYTIPITYAQSLVAPQSLKQMLPSFHAWLSNSKFLSAEIMQGLVSALLYTSFFALCPVIFKSIANSGSRATSVHEAEKYALKYYWYFMFVTAFVFTGLADAAISIWNHSFSNVEQSIEQLIENIAAQTPLTTAATWLNWIIVRTTMTLPLQYLLQVNSFLFGMIGWKCCARCVMGGGPGGPVPYRIYVDGGTVFLCVVALAPQSPLVAPFALLYYLVCVPLWRRNCIFMYRPKFDSGGERWPFLSDMLITSLFMGQFLLTLQMVLRDAFGPAALAAFPAVPTYLYRNYLLKRFRKAYDDAGLLQTSLLDGWDNTIQTSVEKREEFRQFLVDSHKAAYIPVCIAGGATNILTAEPAVVIPSENDDMLGCADVAPSSGMGGKVDDAPPNYFMDLGGISTPTVSQQRGACMRRTVSFSVHPTSSYSPSYANSDKVPATPVSKRWENQI